MGSVLWRIKLLTCGVVSAINELQYSSQGGNKIISQNENHLGNSNSSIILGRNSLVIPKTKKKAISLVSKRLHQIREFAKNPVFKTSISEHFVLYHCVQ